MGGPNVISPSWHPIGWAHCRLSHFFSSVKKLTWLFWLYLFSRFAGFSFLFAFLEPPPPLGLRVFRLPDTDILTPGIHPSSSFLLASISTPPWSTNLFLLHLRCPSCSSNIYIKTTSPKMGCFRWKMTQICSSSRSNFKLFWSRLILTGLTENPVFTAKVYQSCPWEYRLIK